MIGHCLTDCEPLINRISGGVSRAAKGADCKSAGLGLRRFESYLPHHYKKAAPLALVLRSLTVCAL